MAETTRRLEAVPPTHDDDDGHSPQEIRAAYPEFSNRLIARMNELVPLEQSARANLDEQIMTAPGDEGDASVLDTSADYFLQLANNHQQELLEIRDALERITRGVYGVCEKCEEPIGKARLLRMPTAKQCIECQETTERGMMRGPRLKHATL